MSSFGRGLSSGLAALPTQFDSTRNPIDGSIDPCVFGQDGGGCLTPQLGSATAIQYRNRGVQALLSSRTGRWSYGLGIGYDQRRLLVPATPVLAVLDRSQDESYYPFITSGRETAAASTPGLPAFAHYFPPVALCPPQ